VRGRAEGAEVSTGSELPAIHGSSTTSEPAFQPRDITSSTKLTDLLYLTDEQFREMFKSVVPKTY
jgi:epoxyqueuosine reductase QueG